MRRLSIKLAIGILLPLGIAGAALIFFLEKMHIEKQMLGIIAGSLGVLILITFIIAWNISTRPLHKITQEMKRLLTGRSYHRLLTKRKDEIGVIAHFFNTVTQTVEHISGTLEKEKRMEEELSVATRIQKEILPKKPPEIPGWNIIANTKSAAEIGGDTYNFIPAQDNVYMYLGDATGHGVPAGLVMIMTDTLIHASAEKAKDAKEVLVATNKILKQRLAPAVFMTMVLFRYNLPTQELYFAGAGHEHIVHYSISKKNCDQIKTGGIALGMISDNSKVTKETKINLEKGDTLVLYSDGLTEGKNTAGERFGLDRLTLLLEQHGHREAQDIFDRISGKFSEFTEQAMQEDDITLMVFKYVGI